MELPDRIKNISNQFDKYWRSIHSEYLTREQNQHCLYWLKNINAVIEDLESNVLGLEKAIKGNDISKEHQRELDASTLGDEMFQRWLPLIMYGEMNRSENFSSGGSSSGGSSSGGSSSGYPFSGEPSQ